MIGGNNRFDRFLSPAVSLPIEQAMLPEAGAGRELMLAGISVVVALAGFLLAWFFYSKRRDLPGKAAAWLGSVYRLVLNKYWVDELYDTVFVRPLIEGSSKVLWRGIDAGTIDEAINDSARGAREVSDKVRQIQSGNIRSYAGWVALGAAAVVLYMILVGVR
jgi:NADH-quinone oxidoreductase subunit L